jgi:hypothetical protein
MLKADVTECRLQAKEASAQDRSGRPSTQSTQRLLYGRVCASSLAFSKKPEGDTQLEHAKQEGNPVWVRPSTGSHVFHEGFKAALLSRGGSSAMPIKKRPIFADVDNADMVALRALQQDMPVKKVVRDWYLLSDPPRTIVFAPPPGLLPSPR